MSELTTPFAIFLRIETGGRTFKELHMFYWNESSIKLVTEEVHFR